MTATVAHITIQFKLANRAYYHYPHISCVAHITIQPKLANHAYYHYPHISCVAHKISIRIATAAPEHCQ
jgi:hypothetical protein